MQNNPASDLHKTTRTKFTSLFGQTKLVLEETPKAITPFGGGMVDHATVPVDAARRGSKLSISTYEWMSGLQRAIFGPRCQ